MDVMTELGFLMDDAQVASELCEKFWAEIPGIYFVDWIGGIDRGQSDRSRRII